MPIPIKILHSNGVLLEAPISADTLNEIALKEPKGIYTVARTFQRTQAFLFNAHLDRLEESARLENIALSLDRKLLRQNLLLLIEESGFDESRFRITIPYDTPEQIWLALEPLQLIQPKLKQQGVLAATLEVKRPNPRSKSNAWVDLRHEAVSLIPDHVYEGIILSPGGQLMEGFSSNFYAILGDTLYTAESGILHGIARRVVLAVAPDIIPINFDALHLEKLPIIAEAFLTSSSRGIVPIVQIDDVHIGNGKPGAYTLKLSAAYDAWVEEHIEPIYPT